jgi:endonuclease/exonuclease/phosphatase family metal-dependent hydrolase
VRPARRSDLRVYALCRRAAEAAVVRSGVDTIIEGDGEAHAVVLAGDMNDEPQAATTQILLGPGGSEIGSSGFEQPDKGDATRLWNLGPLIPDDQRYSRIYRGRLELIDHLLVSKALVDRATEVTTGAGQTPSITDNPNERRDATGSDHRPVVATLNL